MPKLMDNNITPFVRSFSFSPVRPVVYEPREKQIKNIRSIMSRIKDYTENMGSVRKCSLGISRVYGTSLEDFCSSVENYIKDTLRYEPYKTAVYELNKYLMRKISYQINSEKILKSYNLIRVIDIIPLVDDYVEEIYKGKEIQQGDRFEKSLTIINILYLMLIGDYARTIHKGINENDKNHLWRAAYEIGFLQGAMCLLESHLDTEITNIHYKSKASKAKDADWKKKHDEMKEINQELDKILIAPLKYAEEQWEKRHESIYHGKMASILCERFKDLGIEKETYKEKLKPIAKKYRYSDFCKGEFKNNLEIERLCNTIRIDKYKIKMSSSDYNINWLNEIIMTPDFYSKWIKKKGNKDLSSELNELIENTHSYRKKKFPELTEEEQTKIKRLNRLLLEHTYRQTPISHKHGLMRGWEGKSTKIRY